MPMTNAEPLREPHAELASIPIGPAGLPTVSAEVAVCEAEAAAAFARAEKAAATWWPTALTSAA